VATGIVTLAFGLKLGSAAVAFALAFVVGGLDMAARTLAEWRPSETKDQPESRIPVH
jgi:hypothetical protein